MATKKAKKTIAKKTAGRKSVPYDLIAKMAKTMSAVQIARKLGRTNKGKDCSHSLRAILSRMRSVGWRDADGKLQKLRVERVGQKKKMAPKKGKKTPTKPAPKPPANASTQQDGKTLAAGDGKEE